MAGVEAVFHAATLHKPHVATSTRQAFVDTNVTGTLNLLEEAGSAGVKSFIYTSTTSVFADVGTGARLSLQLGSPKMSPRFLRTFMARRKPPQRTSAISSIAIRDLRASC